MLCYVNLSIMLAFDNLCICSFISQNARECVIERSSLKLDRFQFLVSN